MLLRFLSAGSRFSTRFTRFPITQANSVAPSTSDAIATVSSSTENLRQTEQLSTAAGHGGGGGTHVLHELFNLKPSTTVSQEWVGAANIRLCVRVGVCGFDGF